MFYGNGFKSQASPAPFCFFLPHLLLELTWVLAIDGASHGHCCAEHLLHGALEVLGHATGAHDACAGDDVLEGDVPAVLHVLHLYDERKDVR